MSLLMGNITRWTGAMYRRSGAVHVLASLILLAFTLGISAESVVDSKHNLSVSGPGTVKASAETEVCIFCHTPHNADVAAPLWNRFSSGAVYTPYNSSTIKASIGQPTGASKLCLSCHDGTMALGMVRSRTSPIGFAGGVTAMPSGAANLGTDLSDDHPISFTFDASLASANGELRDPASLPAVVSLDNNKQLQCTSCHDPHNDQFGDFLVMNNIASALCISCHDKTGWQDSSHMTSTATWNGQGTDPWPHTDWNTVANNACGNCHKPHTAGTPVALLNFADEESNCFSCHNGNVAALNVASDFAKFSVHPVTDTQGVHDPLEDLLNPPRHVECADCHNPHATRNAAAVAPNAPGALAGVKGISQSGAAVQPIQFEYELCYRCHADSNNRGPAVVNRVDPETNTRLEFDPGNASYHPVAAAGQNPDVPSLKAGYTINSQIYCTDCHNSDSGSRAGGNGPDGPHGSLYAPLLERNLVMTDYTAENANTYALCYKCHDRSSIIDDKSFREHQKHIRDVQAACTTCHDPHGSSGNTHLINFNPDTVFPFNGVIEFVDTGRFMGNCTLTCHGKVHNQLNYSP
ncbi:MAG: putative CXXCH cytochrome family protein [Kiritimatiellia bacterium]|jgi:predicted CXXCH cytochrome family protein